MRKIEKTPTDGRDKPKKDVEIAASGSIEVKEKFEVEKSDA